MVSIAALDLNLLWVLHSVLAERSVARAARRLHVTPSAVSNALARLRSTLDDPLVLRDGRGITPTPLALELEPLLARALADLESAITRTPFDPARSSRAFTLATADPGQVTLVPYLVQHLARVMPQATLRVVGIESLVALGDLAASEVDVHIGVAAQGPGIHSEALYAEELVLVTRAKHPLQRQPLTTERLAALRHVAVDMLPARKQPDRVTQAFTRAKLERLVAVTVPTFTAARAVVAASDLVALLPASLVRASDGEVRAVRGAASKVAPPKITIPKVTVPMAMSWHERTEQDAACKFFRHCLRHVALSPTHGKK